MQLFFFVLYCIQVLIFYSSQKKNIAMGRSGPLLFFGQEEEDRVAMKNISCVLYYFSLALCLGVR